MLLFKIESSDIPTKGLELDFTIPMIEFKLVGRESQNNDLPNSIGISIIIICCNLKERCGLYHN